MLKLFLPQGAGMGYWLGVSSESDEHCVLLAHEGSPLALCLFGFALEVPRQDGGSTIVQTPGAQHRLVIYAG